MKETASYTESDRIEKAKLHKRADEMPHDNVNHPKHYTSHPSGVECIQIAEHMGFNLGNALKYIWRAGLKGNAVEDLEKAEWYIKRELSKRRARGCNIAKICPEMNYGGTQ